MSGTGSTHQHQVTVSIDDLVAKYPTYDAYLDSKVEKKDLFFLEDEETARHLYELGFPGKGEHVRREDFDERKRQIELARNVVKPELTDLASRECDLSHSPFLQCIAKREEGNRGGFDSTIIYLRAINKSGHEVSAYIDYADRLQKDDFKPYFLGEKIFMPKPTDLSYYNWNTQTLRSTGSCNYEVIANSTAGILFRHKRDRRYINVDPTATDPGVGTTRISIQSPEYLQCNIFDHNPRRQV